MLTPQVAPREREKEQAVSPSEKEYLRKREPKRERDLSPSSEIVIISDGDSSSSKLSAVSGVSRDSDYTSFNSAFPSNHRGFRQPSMRQRLYQSMKIQQQKPTDLKAVKIESMATKDESRNFKNEKLGKDIHDKTALNDDLHIPNKSRESLSNRPSRASKSPRKSKTNLLNNFTSNNIKNQKEKEKSNTNNKSIIFKNTNLRPPNSNPKNPSLKAFQNPLTNNNNRRRLEAPSRSSLLSKNKPPHSRPPGQRPDGQSLIDTLMQYASREGGNCNKGFQAQTETLKSSRVKNYQGLKKSPLSKKSEVRESGESNLNKKSRQSSSSKYLGSTESKVSRGFRGLGKISDSRSSRLSPSSGSSISKLSKISRSSKSSAKSNDSQGSRPGVSSSRDSISKDFDQSKPSQSSESQSIPSIRSHNCCNSESSSDSQNFLLPSEKSSTSSQASPCLKTPLKNLSKKSISNITQPPNSLHNILPMVETPSAKKRPQLEGNSPALANPLNSFSKYGLYESFENSVGKNQPRNNLLSEPQLMALQSAPASVSKNRLGLSQGSMFSGMKLPPVLPLNLPPFPQLQKPPQMLEIETKNPLILGNMLQNAGNEINTLSFEAKQKTSLFDQSNKPQSPQKGTLKEEQMTSESSKCREPEKTTPKMHLDKIGENGLQKEPSKEGQIAQNNFLIPQEAFSPTCGSLLAAGYKSISGIVRNYNEDIIDINIRIAQGGSKNKNGAQNSVEEDSKIAEKRAEGEISGGLPSSSDDVKTFKNIPSPSAKQDNYPQFLQKPPLKEEGPKFQPSGEVTPSCPQPSRPRYLGTNNIVADNIDGNCSGSVSNKSSLPGTNSGGDRFINSQPFGNIEGYFAVFDGHGGFDCAEFAAKEVKKKVFQSDLTKESPSQMLTRVFAETEQRFLQEATKKDPVEGSGSCALVGIKIGKDFYVANLGDSRLIMAHSGGSKAKVLTRDMRPGLDSEKDRVVAAGGRIYQSSWTEVCPVSQIPSKQFGPLRVFPGRLSITRSFGDVEAKLPQYGGKPGVLISVPEISKIEINSEVDFIILGCDGIFDKLTNEETIQAAWKGIERAVNQRKTSLSEVLQAGVEEVLDKCMAKRAPDNLSAILICFKPLEELKSRLVQQASQDLLHQRLSNMLMRSRPEARSTPGESMSFLRQRQHYMTSKF